MNSEKSKEITHDVPEIETGHETGTRVQIAEKADGGYRADRDSDDTVPSIAEIIEEEWPRMEAALRYLADR